MRNIKFWCVMSVLLLAVLFSMGAGCGGSLDDEPEKTPTTTPPTVYDPAKVLTAANWRTTGGGTAEISNYTGYTNYEMRLSEVSNILFPNVTADENYGTMTVSGDTTWRIVMTNTADQTVRSVNEEKTVQLKSQRMKMEKRGRNSWHCIPEDNSLTLPIMDITISSDTQISVTYEDETSISVDNKNIKLEFTTKLNFKR